MPSSPSPSRTTNLLGYHRPRQASKLKSRINGAPIPALSQESKRCLRNLATYRPPPAPFPIPRSRLAAVLVALFVGRHGDLYVLLSRRSMTLRTYAGDTSLPGGKVDVGDRSLEDTARREAYEEIGLPRDRRKVPLLCVLEPFLAKDLIVTPVVVLILDNTLRPILNQAEVSSLFSHPLLSFLSSVPPFPAEPESEEVPYHTSFDFDSDWGGYQFRVHQFLTGREAGGIKPVFGLTAAMLIHTSTIAAARPPSFDVFPPSPHPNAPPPSTYDRIAWALLHRKGFRDACEEEGLDLGKVWAFWEGGERRRREGEGKGKGGKKGRKSKEGEGEGGKGEAGKRYATERGWKSKL